MWPPIATGLRGVRVLSSPVSRRVRYNGRDCSRFAACCKINLLLKLFVDGNGVSPMRKAPKVNRLAASQEVALCLPKQQPRHFQNSFVGAQTSSESNRLALCDPLGPRGAPFDTVTLSPSHQFSNMSCQLYSKPRCSGYLFCKELTKISNSRRLRKVSRQMSFRKNSQLATSKIFRSTQVYELSAQERICPCCGREREEIDTDESWQIEHITGGFEFKTRRTHQAEPHFPHCSTAHLERILPAEGEILTSENSAIVTHERGKTLRRLRLRSLLIIAVLLFLPVIPCYAYGDPTGGNLFQVLLPALAAVWGMWLIFANKIRHGVRMLFRKIRGTPTVN